MSRPAGLSPQISDIAFFAGIQQPRLGVSKGLILVALTFVPGLLGQVSVLTWHNDSGRTGQNLQETILQPANVNSAVFGKLFTIAVDGKVDAQPLYVPALTIPGQGTHNVLYVVTEHDSVYAFDADTGARLWQISVLGTGESTSDDRGCSQVTPEIGITSTLLSIRKAVRIARSILSACPKMDRETTIKSCTRWT